MKIKSSPKHIGILHPSDLKPIFPTTEIRLMRRFLQLRKLNLVNFFSLGGKYLYEHQHIAQLKIDLVVIQRNAISAQHVEAFIEGLQKTGIPIVYEIDDDLLKATEEHYFEYQIAIQTFLQKADLVTVSTPQLKERFSSLNKRIEVVPNLLDDVLWFKSGRPPLKAQTGTGEVKVLYMGSQTHDQDVEMMAAAATKII